MTNAARLILMGTGPFAVPAFDAVAQAGYEIVMVVTRPMIVSKSRKGPPPAPVRDWANQRGYPLIDPPSINDDAVVEQLKSAAADLAVVCDYGQILSANALAATRLGGLNLHGSLLPKYRGAAPVQWAVLNGDAVSGVSVLYMTPRLDGGPIVAKAETKIQPHETSGALEERLSLLGVEPTVDAIEAVLDWNGESSIGESQDPALVTKAPRLKKSDGAIDWGQSAREVDCHVRGMQPWPVAFTMFKPKSDKPALRVAVLEIRETDESSEGHHSGEVRLDDGCFVATDDRWVEVLRLQPAGKKPMTGSEFSRGHQPPAGSRFFA